MEVIKKESTVPKFRQIDKSLDRPMEIRDVVLEYNEDDKLYYLTTDFDLYLASNNDHHYLMEILSKCTFKSDRLPTSTELLNIYNFSFFEAYQSAQIEFMKVNLTFILYWAIAKREDVKVDLDKAIETFLQNRHSH